MPKEFRAWDGENMHYWDSVTHRAIGEITDTPYPKLFYLPMSYLVGDSNDWKWMQWTGLKDRNGRKIFEGDICACVGYDGRLYDHFNVECQEYNATKDIGTGGIFMGYNIPHRDIVVVGNIYQNPELSTG